MTQSFSLYLDLIRFVSALAVLLDHLSSQPFTKGVIWSPLGRYGAVAVAIFFVLSGYVIAYVSSTKENSAERFAIARASRLYSVTLFALPLTFLSDHIGMSLNPSFYSLPKVLWKPESFSGYLSSLFFVNEWQTFNFNGIAPGTNGPYWSLSFEVTYYLIAAIALFARPRIWLVLVPIILSLAGKTIAAMLPLWACGFFLYRNREEAPLPRPTAYALLALSAGFIVAAPHFLSGFDNAGFFFPWGRGPFNRNLLLDYLVAIAFCIHLVSARQILSGAASMSEHARQTIRWLGSLTFPLYCLHYPLLCLLSAVNPWGPTTNEAALFTIAVIFAVVAAVLPLTDFLRTAIRERLYFLMLKPKGARQIFSSGE